MIHNKPFAYTARTSTFRGTYHPKRPIPKRISRSTHGQTTNKKPKDIPILQLLASLSLFMASVIGTISTKRETIPYTPPIIAPEVAVETAPNNVPYPQQPVSTTQPSSITSNTPLTQEVKDTVVMTGQSVNGNTIELHQVGPSNPSAPGQKILVIGAIHGNEYKKLPEHLTEAIMQNPTMIAGNTLYYIPELNPDGIVNSRRQNANNVDLNRNFPAINWASAIDKGPSPASEPETQFAMKVIESIQPDLVIDVHANLNTVLYFGSQSESIAKKMAADMGYNADDMAHSDPAAATHGLLCTWSPSPCIIVEVDDGHGESNYDRIFNKVGNALVKLMSNQYNS